MRYQPLRYKALHKTQKMKLTRGQVAKVNTVPLSAAAMNPPGRAGLEGRTPLSVLLSLLRAGPASSPRHHRGAGEPLPQPSHLPGDAAPALSPGSSPGGSVQLLSNSLARVSSRNSPGSSSRPQTSFPTNINPTALPRSSIPGGGGRPRSGAAGQTAARAPSSLSGNIPQSSPSKRKPRRNAPPPPALAPPTPGVVERLIGGE